MPGKVDELLTHWGEEVSRGLRFRKQFGVDTDWPRFRDYYRHNFQKGELNVNLVFASIASESPSVLFKFPHITASALRPGFEALAYLVESVDNRLAVQQDLANECRDVLIDNATCGTGAVILGYDSQFGYSMSSPGAATAGETFTQLGRKTGEKLEYETNIQRGMPWCLRVLPDDFIVPWGTSRFSDCPWFAFRFTRPLRDAKADEKYDKKARDQLQPSSKEGTYSPRNEEGKYFEGGYPEELHPVFMWQIHDRRSGKVFTIADGCDHFLRNERDVLQTRLGLPAEIIQFQKDPVWFWGIPEIRYYEGHQDEMNEIIDHRKAMRESAIIRLITTKDAISSAEKAKIRSGEPVIIIELDKVPGGDIRNVIQALQPFQPYGFTAEKEDIWNDVRAVMGKSKPYMGEQLGKTHITKYETQTAMTQASGRDAEKREKVARFIERIMSKQNEIIFRHWNGKRVEQVVGPDLVPYWVEFIGSELRSDYLLSVAVDDLGPVTREDKIKEAQGLLELMTKDQQFMEMYPDAAMQIRKTILTQFPWLNFRNFEPRDGVGNNQQQPMDVKQFQNEFPKMRKTSMGKNTPNPMQVVKS